MIDAVTKTAMIVTTGLSGTVTIIATLLWLILTSGPGRKITNQKIAFMIVMWLIGAGAISTTWVIARI